MTKTLNYQKTIYACFMACIVQAVIINFAPLLFLTFQRSYDIPLSKITLLITANFVIQFLVDLISAGIINRIGCRTAIVFAMLISAFGFVSLVVLPDLCSDPFTGILLATVMYAIGGGLIEVLTSPIMEACPTRNKEKAMSMLHSFYCWGQVGVVFISTVFFTIFGIKYWKMMALIWAVLPVINAAVFAVTPIAALESGDKRTASVKELFKSKLFWIFMLMMLCSGASEQAVSQWVSTFAEKGLGISKSIGDIAGPMTFAACMGISRFFYGKYGDKINLDKFMLISGVLCIVSYLVISLIPIPALGLLGCALCGLSVGIAWPGTLSKASALLRGGTEMFAFFALAGDIGCTAGPTLAGMVSGSFNDNLGVGIFSAIVFPIAFVISLLLCRNKTADN